MVVKLQYIHEGAVPIVSTTLKLVNFPVLSKFTTNLKAIHLYHLKHLVFLGSELNY